MAISERKHTVPAATEAPSRAAFLAAFDSINDIVPVANTTERATAVTNIGPTSTKPLIVYRADATVGRELEVTENGTTWKHIYIQDPPAWTSAASIPGVVVAASWVVTNLNFCRSGEQLFVQGTAARPSWVSGETILTLPSGWRPIKDTEFLARITVSGTATYYHMILTSAGQLQIHVDNSTGAITGSSPDTFAVIGTPCLLA